METNLTPKEKEIESKATSSQGNSIQLRTSLIRPCDRYKDEYQECKSSKGQRYQIFVHGELSNCEQWAEDLANCKKWSWNSDEEAAKAIIESEIRRLDERLVPHLHNPVWRKRKGPPEDWNIPLPEFMELTKKSYLSARKRKEEQEPEQSNCAIQ